MRAPESFSDPAELLDENVIEDPHPFFERIRNQNAVSRVGETGIHLVATWEVLLDVLSREDDFSANLTGVLVRGQNGIPEVFELPVVDGTQVIATADEPRHRVHRRLVQPRMAEARALGLEGRIRSWSKECLSDLFANGGGDFARVSEIVPSRVIGHVLGLPDGDAQRHRAWSMMGGAMLAGDIDLSSVGGLAAETGKMAEYLNHHLEKASEQEESESESGLLSVLAAGVRVGEINRSEAIGIAIVMFGAGGESTSSLIGSAVRLLAIDPDLADRLRCSPALVPRFLEEVLRLEPPFKFHYRAVRRPCELDGYSLGPGDRLMLLWASANRDPALFSSPNQLSLERKHPKHHLSFGRGRHFCVGAHLARLQARVVIEDLLAGTRHFELDPNETPRHARSIFVRRLERLPILIR